ncbi:sugar ABC transporter ATP-binding protein [Ancylobacter sp. 6x-1]|uniref:Sugar ABC transporter ATP-binding protein n=1 Tax=Ancylobacter crimeensis TaxID=2579147 RepID=A0ABT0DDW5_9HYPH|nr:sugar ABC transporter ATP-binding protein [Ancylobacter crimeensis]MCK0198164.1 sugar ABC transporter ATP-binding protein [Ancylobacter crimeensis]
MAEPLIELRGVTKRFPGMTALDAIDFRIAPAEILCLAGENGSGKSTLIKIVSGVYAYDEGELLIDGAPVSGFSPRAAIAAGVQVIYQDFSLFPSLTVAENLAMGRLLSENRRLVAPAECQRLGAEALARLDVTMDLDARVGSLSTADRQIVAIARALMSRTRLLIMDEPTTALTGREVERLFAIVREIKAKGIAVLFVSHKMREMLEISERICVFRNGRKVEEGPTAEFTEGRITRAMTGQDIGQERYVWSGDIAAEPRLSVRALGVGERVHDVSFDLRAGEIVGLSGLLGSGRTELALALFGMEPGHRGEVRMDGAPLKLETVQQAVEAGIAYVPEDRLSEGLFMTQSIARNMVASAIDRVTHGPFLSDGEATALAERTVADMRIATTDVDKQVGKLSGGNQQRVIIGRWLLTGPRVLILNGPTVGVDIGSKAEIHRRIRDLAVKDGLAVLMISDDVPELLQNCNRILLMHRGAIEADLDPRGLEEDDIHTRLKTLR